MNQLVSLEGYSPELRDYLLAKQWPEIMEVGLQATMLHRRQDALFDMLMYGSAQLCRPW